jgi:PAS domain S-box-containing protein
LHGEVIPGVEIRKFDHITNQERTVLLSYEPAVDEAHEVVGVCVSMVDITDRKVADEAQIESKLRDVVLLKTQAQLKAVVAAVPFGILLADVNEGVPDLANPEALRIAGEPLPETTRRKQGNPWIAPGPDSNLVVASEVPLTRALLYGEATPAEEVLLHKPDGTEAWVSVSGAPILGADDEIVGGIVLIQDIDSAKHERQRLLDLAEAMVKELVPKSSI